MLFDLTQTAQAARGYSPVFCFYRQGRIVHVEPSCFQTTFPAFIPNHITLPNTPVQRHRFMRDDTPSGWPKTCDFFENLGGLDGEDCFYDLVEAEPDPDFPPDPQDHQGFVFVPVAEGDFEPLWTYTQTSIGTQRHIHMLRGRAILDGQDRTWIATGNRYDGIEREPWLQSALHLTRLYHDHSPEDVLIDILHTPQKAQSFLQIVLQKYPPSSSFWKDTGLAPVDRS